MKNTEWLKNEFNKLPFIHFGFSVLKQREEFVVKKDDVVEIINQLEDPLFLDKMENEKLEILFNQLNNIINDLSSVRLEYEVNIEYGETGKEEKQIDHLSELIEIEEKLRNIERNLYFDTYESRFLNE